MFLETNEVDVLLVSETHFTNRTDFSIPKYKMYHTMHPDGTAHGSSAIPIKENIKHYTIDSYCTEKIQATNIMIEDPQGQLLLSAIYIPPKHNMTQ